MKSYKVLAALKEDINSPSIWVKDEIFQRRTIAKITTENGKSIWVDVQIIDKNYIKNYNNNPNTIKINESDRLIIANQWYRDALGLKKKQSHNLKIEPIRCSWLFPFRQMQAALKHPDSSIRICADLAIVSVFLGLLGLVIGIIR